MSSEGQIVKMTTAIRLAIKVMGDRFGSTEQDVVRAIQSMQALSEPSLSLGNFGTDRQLVTAG